MNPSAVLVTLPVRLVSTANAREHWAVRARRARAHRTVARLALAARVRDMSGGRVLVTITRVAPRELDGDNLAAAAKAIRDGVADALGTDDRDPRVAWMVGQRRGRAHEYGVEIRLEPQEAP